MDLKVYDFPCTCFKILSSLPLSSLFLFICITKTCFRKMLYVLQICLLCSPFSCQKFHQQSYSWSMSSLKIPESLESPAPSSWVSLTPRGWEPPTLKACDCPAEGWDTLTVVELLEAGWLDSRSSFKSASWSRFSRSHLCLKATFHTNKNNI